jgi:hypothetical protein
MRVHRPLAWEKCILVGLVAVAMAACDGGAERCADCLHQPAVGQYGGRGGGAAGADSPAVAGSAGRDGIAGLGGGGPGAVGGAGASPTVAGSGGAGATSGGLAGQGGVGSARAGAGGGLVATGAGGSSTGAAGGVTSAGQAGMSGGNGGGTTGGMSGGMPGGTDGGVSGGAGATGTVSSGLVLLYKLDDGAGATASDSSGNGRKGTLTTLGGGTASFSTAHAVGTGSLKLVGSSSTVGGYVAIPASLKAMGAGTEVTIAAWVNVTTDRVWQRVFDFNNSTKTGYMYLTTDQNFSSPSSLKFAITLTGNTAEQSVQGTGLLSTGAWHHVAVTLGTGMPYTATLYVDGAVAGTNTSMTFRPSALGDTANNWIGRSPFTDPLFDGFVDDFRVYDRELSLSEVAALATSH